MGQSGRCTWHDAKAETNLAKHGLDFDEVSDLFKDAATFMLVRQDMRHDYGELRFNALAELEWLVVNVTFTPRDDRYHLISARPASREERTAYHDARQENRSRS